jgi:hypothetical protein
VRSGAAEPVQGFFGGAALASAPHYGALPLSFEPNVGQADRSVRYLAHGAGYTLLLTDAGAILSYVPRTTNAVRASLAALQSPLHDVRGANETQRPPVTMRLSPIGGASHPRIVAAGRRPGIVNYFIGNNPKGWHTDIPTFSRVVYRNVYRGIDLTFYGRGGQLEYDWLIHPHANPAAIAMKIGGAKSVHLDRSGNLLLGTSLGVIRQRAPSVYQLRGLQRIAVPGAYCLDGRARVGFRLGHYDRAQPLVIDPVLAYSTYLGGGTIAEGVAFDSSGDAYLTGGVFGFIPTRTPYQPAKADGQDAFVTELNPSGSDLVYSTYLGGAMDDHPYAIAVDGSGSAYITGGTNSSDFPGLPGVVVPPGSAAFVVKLSKAGDQIVYAHGYPNSVGIYGTGIAVDGAGDAFYTATVYTPPGNAVTTYAIVNELAPDGSLVHNFGVNGSSGYTNATSVALDGQGNVYVAGGTNAPDFYVVNALQPKPGGGYDAFLFKLDSGFNVAYITFLGGAEEDYASAVAVDARGNVYVAGSTASTNFPTASPLQSSLAGKTDGFVTELNPSGTAYIYSTYLGGHESSVEALYAIAVDGAGNAYVTGETTAADYPTVNPLRNSSFKGDDAVVTEIAAGGRSLVYSTFLGGGANDGGFAITSYATGNVYVAGYTMSTDFPTSPSAYQHGLSGTQSAFVVKLVASVPPPATPHIFLKSSRITSGKKLQVAVTTSPNAEVTITIQAKSGKIVLFHIVATGRADGAGKLTRNIKITYNPHKQVKAQVMVEAKTAGGSTASSTTITILHHP